MSLLALASESSVPSSLEWSPPPRLIRPSATIWNVFLASSILPFSASRMPRPFAAYRLLPLFCRALV